MVPELGMDWLIELTTEQLYGPTTIGAIQEFLNLGEVNADTILINARDGSSSQIKDIATAGDSRRGARRTRHASSGSSRSARASAPVSSSASANWSTPSLRNAARWRRSKNGIANLRRNTSRSSSSVPDNRRTRGVQNKVHRFSRELRRVASRVGWASRPPVRASRPNHLPGRDAASTNRVPGKMPGTAGGTPHPTREPDAPQPT